MNPTLLKDTKVEKTALLVEGKLIEETVVDESEEKLKAEKKKAYLKGREEGEIAGYEKSRAEFHSLFPLIRSISQKLLEKKETLLFELKQEMIEFSIAIAEKVLRQELSSKETFAKMIGSYLTFCTPQLQKDTVKVALAPEDLMMLESVLEDIYYDKNKIVEVMFFPDALLQRGDFRIETKSLLLNCTISRELDDLRSKIL